MSGSGHSKNGMFDLYHSQSRLSQNVWASSSFCLFNAWAGSGAVAARVNPMMFRKRNSKSWFIATSQISRRVNGQLLIINASHQSNSQRLSIHKTTNTRQTTAVKTNQVGLRRRGASSSET